MKLTDVAVKSAQAKEKQYTLFDEKGLFLLVKPTGSKLWRWKYSWGGKEKRLALGQYPEVSLKAARETRDKCRAELRNGIDPGAAKQALKASVLALGETFELVAREWHTKFLPGWTTGHAARIMVSLEKDAFPWLGEIPIKEMTAPQVLSVARRVESRGAVESAHRLVGNIGQVCRYAVACGKADSDPTRDLRGALSPTNEKHHASICDPKGVATLLRAIDGYEGSFIVRCAMQLASLVFVRPGELRHAEWTEIDLEAKEWRIPGHKMKMREQHIVPLSRQAIEILYVLRPLTDQGRYLFPSVRTSERPISENTVNAALRRLGYSKDEMTGHGFRSMASTMLNEQGWNRDAIERQLAHAERDNIRAAYNFAEHLPERRRMMQAWADYLDGLKETGKIIPLRHADGMA